MDTDEDTWLELDEQLTVTDGPEGTVAREALFGQLLACGSHPGGLLPLEDVQAGLSRLLLDAPYAVLGSLIPGIADIKPAIRRAFTAAQELAPSNIEADGVDRSQFHALLVYLRYYFELLAYFRRNDTSEDMGVNRAEVMSIVPMMTDWNIDMVQVLRMWPRDQNDMKFNEFADWCLGGRLRDGYAFDDDKLQKKPESQAQTPVGKNSRETLQQHDEPCKYDDSTIIPAEMQQNAWATLISNGSEGIARRNTLFKQAAEMGSGGLSLNRAWGTLPEDWDDRITDPAPPVKLAFNTAKELAPSGGRSDHINRKQFHIFLTYLHYYLELLGLLKTNDTSEAAQVSRVQCMDIMGEMMEQDWNFKAVDYLKIVPKGSGTLLPETMSLHEFADSCLRHRLEICSFDELDADEEQVLQTENEQMQLQEEQRQQLQEVRADVQGDAGELLAEARSGGITAIEEPPVETPKASPVRSPVQRRSPAVTKASMNSTGNKRLAASWSSNTGFSTVGDRPERKTFLTTMSTVRSLPSISFGLRGPTSAPNLVPGPGSYPHHDGDKHSKYNVAPQYNFGGGGSRFGLGPPSSDLKPGPGAYKPKDQRYHNSTQVGFGSSAARGRPNAVRQWSPGPGEHELKTFIHAGPAYSQRGRPRPALKSNSLPGPGAYHPSVTHTEREAQKVGFGTSAREDFVAKHETAGPGPGAYSLGSFKGMGMDTGNKFSMKSRRYVHDLEPYMMPGPGMYDSHATCFGYSGRDRSLT